jgi:hypothetical protein
LEGAHAEYPNLSTAGIVRHAACRVVRSFPRADSREVGIPGYVVGRQWVSLTPWVGLVLVACVGTTSRPCRTQTDCETDGQDGFCTNGGFCARECVRDTDCPCGSFCAVGCGLCIRDDCAGAATCFANDRGLDNETVLGVCRDERCRPSGVDASTGPTDAGVVGAGDAGAIDARDGGSPDAGVPDGSAQEDSGAGRRICDVAPAVLPMCVHAAQLDAGAPVASVPTDAGATETDGGPDAGMDAGPDDSGPPDAVDGGM